jgi:HEPN domain-containing protein
MTARRSQHVKLFEKLADQRFDEAEFLFEHSYTTVTVYLAGYAVECVLKALLLSRTPSSEQKNLFDSFRGNKAHSFESLKNQLRKKGVAWPASLAKAFTDVSQWSTEWRYKAGRIPHEEAEEFLKATSELLKWAKGSI